jgi:hypothetical protein
MSYEKHDIVKIDMTKKDRPTKEIKGVWLYRNKYNELINYRC